MIISAIIPFIFIVLINFVVAYNGYDGYGFDEIFPEGFSLAALATNEWFNAALLFLLIFTICLFALQKVFRESRGAAIMASIVLGMLGSLGIIYYYGPIATKLAWWVIALFVVIILTGLYWQLRRRGPLTFIALLVLALVWFFYARQLLCRGVLPHVVCVVLDAAAIVILIIAVFKLLVKTLNWLRGRGFGISGGGRVEKPEKGEETVDLVIETTGGGTTNPSPGVHSCIKNSIAQIIPIPLPSHHINYWKVNGKKVITNVLTIQMKYKIHAKAVFSRGERRGPSEGRKREEEKKKEKRKKAPKERKPKIKLSASPSRVGEDMPVTLRWKSKNAVEVILALERGKQILVSLSGSYVTRPSESVTYTVIASNKEGKKDIARAHVEVMKALPFRKEKERKK